MLLILVEPFLDGQIIAMDSDTMAQHSDETILVKAVQKSLGLTGQIKGVKKRQPVFNGVYGKFFFCKPAQVMETEKTSGPENLLYQLFWRFFTKKLFILAHSPILSGET
jgi:hypothetical protein